MLLNEDQLAAPWASRALSLALITKRAIPEHKTTPKLMNCEVDKNVTLPVGKPKSWFSGSYTTLVTKPRSLSPRNSSTRERIKG